MQRKSHIGRRGVWAAGMARAKARGQDLTGRVGGIARRPVCLEQSERGGERMKGQFMQGLVGRGEDLFILRATGSPGGL